MLPASRDHGDHGHHEILTDGEPRDEAHQPVHEEPERRRVHIDRVRDPPELAGRYFSDCRPKQASDEARDEAVAERLWAWTEDWVGTARPA
jgi:hypothetical protein